tara:strand:+ start:86 stop:298 length:213 start_codon:yes stop_codon:yes gene_type:complete
MDNKIDYKAQRKLLQERDTAHNIALAKLLKEMETKTTICTCDTPYYELNQFMQILTCCGCGSNFYLNCNP